MSIVLQSSGGGSLTIQEPVTASNLTATLPAASGEIAVSGNMPAFSAYATVNQSVTSGVSTKLIFSTEAFDTASAFDSTTNYRFTPLVAGYYQINCGTCINAATSLGTSSVINLYKNGSNYRQLQFGHPVSYSATLSDVVYMNGTTDYLEVYGQINGGVGVRFEGNAFQTWFSGCLVRSA